MGRAAHRVAVETTMSNHYEHTQPGTLMIVVGVIGVLVAAAAAYGNAGSARWIGVIVVFVMLITTWLFSSLTIIVNNNEVRWYFGPGLWSYRTALYDIESSHVVRNSWSNGWGIRVAPGFRLYNVSGLDAVELKLKNGEIRRIGTDDAPGLAAALRRN
jgi:hypothetical protein